MLPKPLLILLSGIVLTIFAPILFTQITTCISFGKSNEIGDTIGGITAPIVGTLNAILVYLAFQQQNVAIAQPKEDEKEKRKNIKELILFDLKHNISPTLKRLKREVEVKFKSLNDKERYVIIEEVEYVELNLDIYNSVGMEYMYLVFGQDILKISKIYRDVEYIKNRNFGKLYAEFNSNNNMATQRYKNGGKEYDELKKQVISSFELNVDSTIKTSKRILKDINNVIMKHEIMSYN